MAYYTIGLSVYTHAPLLFVVCLSVITSRFRIKALYIIPGSRQTPHILFCRLVSSGDDNKLRKYKDKETDKEKIKVLQRLNVCYIFERHGVQGFQILYWLSFGNDNGTHKDKEKVFEKPKVCYIFQKRGFQYFSGMTIFQG